MIRPRCSFQFCKLGIESISKIKSEIKVGASWDPKEGLKIKGDWNITFEGDSKDLKKIQKEGVRPLERAKSSAAKAISTTSDLVPEMLSKSKKVCISGTVIAVPVALITVNALEAANSSTYTQSLDDARRDLYLNENFDSFDSDKSTKEDTLALES
jgi:hypothetical protein